MTRVEERQSPEVVIRKKNMLPKKKQCRTEIGQAWSATVWIIGDLINEGDGQKIWQIGSRVSPEPALKQIH